MQQLTPKERRRIYQSARTIPLEKYCELCPEDDLQLSDLRHHVDYEYPKIFVSVCLECHQAIENDKINCIPLTFRPLTRKGRVEEMASIRRKAKRNMSQIKPICFK
jgi:hypothetical protein